MSKDIFERLSNAGRGMATRDPNEYIFMISCADAMKVHEALLAARSAAIPGDWASVLEIANRPLSGTEFDATVLWCQALVAARSAALEEAAKVAESVVWHSSGPATCDDIAAAIRELTKSK